MADPGTWPKVGDPSFGFDVAADCPATDDPGDLHIPLYCTRDAGHPMPHVADGLTEIMHVWADPAPEGGACEDWRTHGVRGEDPRSATSPADLEGGA